MGYCEASVHPVGELSWQLYQSIEQAIEAVIAVLKALRGDADGESADTINDLLDRLEAAPGPLVTFFEHNGREWAIYVQPLNGDDQ